MSEPPDVSHRDIYDRLAGVESKVDRLQHDTAHVVAAFAAAEGAFTVLEFIAKMSKPLLWIGALVAAASVAWQNWRAPHG